MGNVNHLELFANRVRSLRLAANLSIERASELGGLSPGFWGEVERNVKEPCLESLYGFAQGLGITVPTLLSFDDQADQHGKRAELFALLTLFDIDQLELIHNIALLAFRYRSTDRSRIR
jgi:transcriptional regulator with XRE-family HTH domain